MGSIGHELQHAVEVLSSPIVTNTRALYLFYQRNGIRAGSVFRNTVSRRAGRKRRAGGGASLHLSYTASIVTRRCRFPSERPEILGKRGGPCPLDAGTGRDDADSLTCSRSSGKSPPSGSWTCWSANFGRHANRNSRFELRSAPRVSSLTRLAVALPGCRQVVRRRTCS